MAANRVSRRLILHVALLFALLVPLQVEARGGGGVLLRILLQVIADGFSVPPPPPPRVAPVPVVIPVESAPAPEPPSERALDPDQVVAALKDQELRAVPPAQPKPFLMRDFNRSFYTILGGSAADGSGLVRQDALQDPAVSVSSGLVQVLTQQFGMRDGGSIPSVDAPPAASPGYVLEVVTTRWELKSVSINPLHLVYGMSHYGVYYHAKFRLTSRHDGRVASTGSCDESPENAGAPTLDETLAGDGKLLKDMLQSVAQQCVSDIEADYFHIPKPLIAG